MPATVALLAGLCIASTHAPPVRGWDITLAPAGEPGERMVLTGRVLWHGRPLPGATVHVYHADSLGRYFIPGSGTTAPRLSGVLRSGPGGVYRVHTVIPGRYEGYPHIHFEVSARGVPLRTMWVNVFRSARLLRDYAYPPGSVPPASGGNLVVFKDSTGTLTATWDLNADGGVPMDTTRHWDN